MIKAFKVDRNDTGTMLKISRNLIHRRQKLLREENVVEFGQEVAKIVLGKSHIKCRARLNKVKVAPI